jgi:hypothetical protein
MASAKQSALDTLHRLYVATLTLQLQAGEPSAAMLATIGSFLAKSGVKATDDSPHMKRLAQSFADLPFKDEPSTPALPATNHEAKH